MLLRCKRGRGQMQMCPAAACVHVCVCACVRTCVRARMHACTCAHACACVDTCMGACMHVCMCTVVQCCVYVYVSACVCDCMRMHCSAHIYVCLQAELVEASQRETTLSEQVGRYVHACMCVLLCMLVTQLALGRAELTAVAADLSRSNYQADALQAPHPIAKPCGHGHETMRPRPWPNADASRSLVCGL